MSINKGCQMDGNESRASPVREEIEKLLDECTDEQLRQFAYLGVVYVARLFGAITQVLTKFKGE